MWVTVLCVICVFSCFRCCTVDQHRSGATLQEDWRPMRSTVLLWPCATDRAAWTVHLCQVELCPPVSTISNIYIQCTVRAAIYVMLRSKCSKRSSQSLSDLQLIGLKLSISNATSNLIQESILFYFLKIQLIMEYTHTVCMCVHSTSNYVCKLRYLLSSKGEKPE